MSRAKQIWAVSVVFLACTGCVVAPESEEPEITSTEAEVPVPRASTPSNPQPAARPTLGSGTLIEELDPAARESICVSVDSDDNVTAMDEFECSVASEMHECAPDDCPWIRCGGCLLHVERNSDALESDTPHAGPPWILEARVGTEGCEVFAGTYQLFLDSTCKAPQRQ